MWEFTIPLSETPSMPQNDLSLMLRMRLELGITCVCSEKKDHN